MRQTPVLLLKDCIHCFIWNTDGTTKETLNMGRLLCVNKILGILKYNTDVVSY